MPEHLNLSEQVGGLLSPTYGGLAAITQANEVLPASTNVRALHTMEVNSTYRLEIPATSSLEVLTFPPRIHKRTTTISVPGATPTFNTDLWDVIDFTRIGTAITSMTTNCTGNPQHGDTLILRFIDNGTAFAITWGSMFSSSGVATLLASTVLGKQMSVGLFYDAARLDWVCMAVDATGY